MDYVTTYGKKKGSANLKIECCYLSSQTCVSVNKCAPLPFSFLNSVLRQFKVKLV